MWIFGSLVLSGAGEAQGANPHEVPAAVAQTQAAQTAPAQPGVSTEEALRTVVARVNNATISLFTVRELLKRTGGSPHGDMKAEKTDAAIQAALDRAVFEELAYQAAVAAGLAPDAAEIGAKVKSMKEKMGGEDGFQKALDEQGLTEAEWLPYYQRSVAVDRILRKEISDVQVSEEQLQQEYEKEKGSFYRRERVLVIDIVFFLKMDDPESVRVAEEVLAQVRDGEDKDPNHLVPNGQFIVHEVELDKVKQPELYLEAKKLKTGEFSSVIRASDALHVIQLKEYVAEKQFTLEDARGLLMNKLQGDARRKRIQEWEAELKKNAAIEITDMSQWKDKL